MLHQSSFLTSNFTHLPRSLHYIPYFTAHVILLFRVTSADKRVALYLRIGLHYLMCVASCNIRLFVYTYFMYSIEEKCRIFSYTPPNKACISSGSTVQEMIGLIWARQKSGTQKHHNRNQEQQELKVKLTFSYLCLSDEKTAKFMYVSLMACILQCNAVEGLWKPCISK